MSKTNVEALNELCEKMTGKPSSATTIKDALNNIYSGISGVESTAETNAEAITLLAEVAGGGGNEGAIIDRTITEIANDTITAIGDYAFYMCQNLQKADFPNVKTVGDNAFYSCMALEEVNFPSLSVVGKSAFYSCTLLAKISAPLTEIKSNAFETCTSLNEITLTAASVCKLGSNALATTSFTWAGGSIYVPADLVDAYKADAQWADYASYIKPIE